MLVLSRDVQGCEVMSAYPNLVQFQKLPDYLQQVNSLEFAKQANEDISVQVLDWSGPIQSFTVSFAMGSPGATNANPPAINAPVYLQLVASETDGQSVMMRFANGMPNDWPQGAWAYWAITVQATLSDGTLETRGLWLKVQG